MKKVIRGRVYDTTKAKKIYETDNGLGYNDLYYISETLYCKKTGEYFLHGDGGAGTGYAKHCGTTSVGAEDIVPLTYNEAKQWAEEHMNGDEYTKEFGDPEADYTNKVMTISIRQKAIDKVKREAQKRDMSVSKLIEDLIESI